VVIDVDLGFAIGWLEEEDFGYGTVLRLREQEASSVRGTPPGHCLRQLGPTPMNIVVAPSFSMLQNTGESQTHRSALLDPHLAEEQLVVVTTCRDSSFVD